MGIKEDISALVSFAYESDERTIQEAAKSVDEWLNGSYCPLADEEELE
jgi:hypothetical protein